MTTASERFVPALGYHWLTGAYDPIVRVTTRERTFKRQLLAQAHLGEARSLLDVGCGTGTFALMAKRAYPDLTVVGLDADPRVLAIARNKATQAGLDVSFLRGSATSLPLLDGATDRVVSSLFFHHLDRDAKLGVVQEIARVLAPDGGVHVADWGPPANLLMRLAFLPIQILDGFPNTADSLDGLLAAAFADAGLVDVHQTGSLPTVFGTMAFYRGEQRS